MTHIPRGRQERTMEKTSSGSGMGGGGIGYKVLRSGRRTLSIEIRDNGIVVRAPYEASDAEIESFVADHSKWILKHTDIRNKRREKLSEVKPLTYEELQELAGKASEVIPGRVRYYAQRIGVTYGRITIRNQRTRWGSCSARGNLNFNCLLMLAPPEVVDSVVVHELCHRKEMNHSERFYAEVFRVFPDYLKWNRWLKENGEELLKRGAV
jgi:predicted metal-dependent hydrolase